MQITTLIENHENKNRKDLRSEHGVSFYIEHEGHAYMSDVGQSKKFAENAAKLGIDLAPVEVLTISHYHYDHGGGLGRFIKENDCATIYLRDSVEADYIAVVAGIPVKFIGLDRGLLKQHEDRIVMNDKNQEVAPGFYLLTDIPHKYPKPSGDQRLKMRYKGEIKPDTFEHEMVTVIEGDDGLVVLTGCAHNGVLNMIAAAQDAFPGEPIQAVIGGFHLNREDDETVREVGEKMLGMDIPSVVTGHCTGDHAMDILGEILGDRLQGLYTGLVMKF